MWEAPVLHWQPVVSSLHEIYLRAIASHFHHTKGCLRAYHPALLHEPPSLLRARRAASKRPPFPANCAQGADKQRSLQKAGPPPLFVAHACLARYLAPPAASCTAHTGKPFAVLFYPIRYFFSPIWLLSKWYQHIVKCVSSDFRCPVGEIPISRLFPHALLVGVPRMPRCVSAQRCV